LQQIIVATVETQKGE